MTHAKTTIASLILGLAMTMMPAAAEPKSDYQVLSTSRTSTMEKELNQAAASGYRFLKVTNTPNVFGGKELVVTVVKESDTAPGQLREYKVLTARGTSSLEKKLNAAAGEGYSYRAQTTLPNVFGGTDTVVILEREETKE